MKRFGCCLLILGIISSMIITGIVQATNPYFHDYGTFEDFPNMVGNWERCAHDDGPIGVDTSRRVYIDLDTGEDVFSCSANFYSYANDPNYTGDYEVSTSINVLGESSISFKKDFNGPWWEYNTNDYRQTQTDNIPQSLSVATAYSTASGHLTEELINPEDSGSNSQPIPNPDTQLNAEENSVYVNLS